MSIAIITGGSRGLGKSMALSLAAKGVGVILTYNSKKSVAEDVVNNVELQGVKAAALQLDVSNTSQFPQFVESVGSILRDEFDTDKFNYLVNNAGFGVHSSIADTTEEQLEQMFNVHFKGPFFLTQKLLPLIADGGRILNLSSGLTRFSFPGYAAYASMKGGLEVLTRYMAKEFAERKIAVNTVAPGAIATDFGGGAVRDNENLNNFIASQTALGRVGIPEDIGGVVASLLSEDTYWINGQRIEASGGINL